LRVYPQKASLRVNPTKLGLNERQKKAVKYIKEKGEITNKEYKKNFGVSKATATRDLSKLVEKNVFIAEAKAKETFVTFLLSQK
jgi:ATP-dependent DNA helicase RecG